MPVLPDDISSFQTITLAIIAGGYIYSTGKLVNSLKGIEKRVDLLEEVNRDLQGKYVLSRDEALKFLHAHDGCKTITRS